MTDALLVEAAGVESAAVARVKERETARLEARKKRKDEKKSVKERASGRLRHRPSINIIELRTERGKQANAEARKQFFPTKNASQYITLMDLNHCNCHWPIDVPSGTMFCGQPALTGKPYCTVHWDRSIDKVRSVYVRKKDSRR